MVPTRVFGFESSSEQRGKRQNKKNRKNGTSKASAEQEIQPQRELIIRVKRKRCEDPAEVICVLENSLSQKGEAVDVGDSSGANGLRNGQSGSFASLSLNGSRKKRLLLSRVTTFEVNDNQSISHDAIVKLKTKFKRDPDTDGAEEEECSKILTLADSLAVATNTIMSSTPSAGSQVKRMKTMRLVAESTTEESVGEGSTGSSGYFIVHATQMALTSTSVSLRPALVSSSLPAAPTLGREGPPLAPVPSTASPKVKVLDPATRSLDRGITIAMKTGNFNEIASAIIIGADPNHQQQLRPLSTSTAASAEGTTSRHTALMAAAKHCNLRMVRRLLQLGVDPTLTDSEGHNALTYVRETRRNQEEAAEIRTLIQTAVLKQKQQQYHQSGVESAGGDMEEDQFVIDLYCVTDAVMGEGEGEEDANPAEGGGESDGNMEGRGVPLRVNGLRILDDRLGHVRISSEEGAYDSDWSDLGDDEDPDSNDERFPGNDYPDEEDDEEEEENVVEDGDEDQLGGGAGDGDGLFGGNGEDDVDSDDERLPRFERNWAVGRVIRPTYMGEDLMTGEVAQQTSASLRKLWEEDDEADAEEPEEGGLAYDKFENGDEVLLPKRNQLLNSYKKSTVTAGSGPKGKRGQNDHASRIADMQDRTGMRFASNPREFDIRGLPKYGIELSDDELDGRYLEDDDGLNSFSNINGDRGGGGGRGWNKSSNSSNGFNYGRNRPSLPRDTVAYDPELDNSSNDEMDL